MFLRLQISQSASTRNEEFNSNPCRPMVSPSRRGKTAFCKTNCRLPVIVQSPRGRTTFCTTNCRLPVVKQSPCAKTTFCKTNHIAPTRPRPLWIPAFAGITLAFRRPHKRMKITARRGWYSEWWSHLSPPLLDSSFRWKDEFGGRGDDPGGYFHSNDDPGDLWGSVALSKPRNIIFVPMTTRETIFTPMTI